MKWRFGWNIICWFHSEWIIKLFEVFNLCFDFSFIELALSELVSAVIWAFPCVLVVFATHADVFSIVNITLIIFIVCAVACSRLCFSFFSAVSLLRRHLLKWSDRLLAHHPIFEETMVMPIWNKNFSFFTNISMKFATIRHKKHWQSMFRGIENF